MKYNISTIQSFTHYTCIGGPQGPRSTYKYKGEPQGPQYITMNSGTSGPLVIAPYREIGDRRSPRRQPCIGGPKSPR